MNNVGDILTFTLAGAPADGGGYTYLFKWWDGTVNTTKVPTVQKQLNMGGTLALSLIQCDQFGQSQTYPATVIVNFQPVIIGAPTVSQNDTFFPFNSVLTSISYDPEHPGGTELSFTWYNGPTFISSGTTAVLSAGTYQNQLEVDAIVANQTITQIITDTQNGVTQLNFYLRGTPPSGLQGSSSSINNSLINSTNNLSEIIIGPNAEVTFTAYANDQSGGQLQFDWSLSTVDGWASDFTFTETPTPLPSGLYKSQITRPVSAESAGTKIAFCTVTNLLTGQTIIFNTTVQLINPDAPTVTSISTDAPIINGGYAVAQAGFVHFTAQAADPNNALLAYRWDFSQPSLTLYGKTVMIKPSDYGIFDEATLEGNGTDITGGPAPILGGVTVTDRYGESSTISLQSFITTLVWPNTQLSPDTSGTGSTTLQKRYFGLSNLSTLQQNDLADLSSDFASSRNFSHAFNTANQFIYFIYPATFGPAAFTVNGVISSDWLLTVVTFNSVTYNVYRSSTVLSGLFQLTTN
jgi:hypothetical protein